MACLISVRNMSYNMYVRLFHVFNLTTRPEFSENNSCFDSLTKITNYYKTIQNVTDAFGKRAKIIFINDPKAQTTIEFSVLREDATFYPYFL
jgi:hypothetical protein